MGNGNITIMALGGAGCRIINKFMQMELDPKFNLLAVDSDLDSLRGSGLPEDKCIQVGKQLRSGRGCGGDTISGQQVLANERKHLNTLLASTDVLIVVTALGGGLATGGLPVVLGVAAKLHITTAVLASLPFSMEGFQRRRVAEDKIKNDILSIADAVIALPSDLLFCSMEAETPIHEAHERANSEMARTLMALASILGGANLFSADFASFTGVLKRRHTLCSMGTAMVDAGDDASSRLMDELLLSPLLGGPENIEHADAVAFSLLGGPELSLGTSRAVLDLCARHVEKDDGKKILLGASTSEVFSGKLQLTALAVRYLDAVVPAAENNPKHQFHRDSLRNIPESDGEQLDLPNLEVEDKGIMENTSPVVINGEDLDVPTYRRRGLVIDAGK